MGLHRAGFDVVGIDHRPQPRYPFAFIRADALRPPVALERFDLIWSSPPCQAFSPLRHMPNARAHPDLVGEIRAALVATGRLFVIENVPGAPLRDPVQLCGTMFGLETPCGRAQLRRHRLFETNLRALILAPPCNHRKAAVAVYGGGDQGLDKRRLARRSTVGVYGHTGGASAREKAQRFLTRDRAHAMGIDWMTNEELSQAIPPAYSELIGRAAMDMLSG